MDGTRVLFGEVDRQAWRSAGTVPFVRARWYQGHITTRQGMRGLALSRTGTAVLAVPPPAVSRGPRHRMSATESGEILAHLITDQETPEAVKLHRLDLLIREHGIRHESVMVEDGVVAPAGHVCFGRLHSLMPGSLARLHPQPNNMKGRTYAKKRAVNEGEAA